MELVEIFEADNGTSEIQIECYPRDGGANFGIIDTKGGHGPVVVRLDTRELGRLNGFLSLCLEAIRRMGELKEDTDCAVCEGTGRLSGEKYDACPACGIKKDNDG